MGDWVFLATRPFLLSYRPHGDTSDDLKSQEESTWICPTASVWFSFGFASSIHHFTPSVISPAVRDWIRSRLWSWGGLEFRLQSFDQCIFLNKPSFISLSFPHLRKMKWPWSHFTQRLDYLIEKGSIWSAMGICDKKKCHSYHIQYDPNYTILHNHISNLNSIHPLAWLGCLNPY